jgi:hypothetical protein
MAEVVEQEDLVERVELADMLRRREDTVPVRRLGLGSALRLGPRLLLSSLSAITAITLRTIRRRMSRAVLRQFRTDSV